ncbi:MAG: hypothetical protein U1F52_03850 [Burkholderiales bacterium]
MTSHAAKRDAVPARRHVHDVLRGSTLAVMLTWGAGTAVQANDFPTSERVEFVLECMRDHPGPEFEMVHKCACALDAIAETLTYDQYVAASTVSKAVTIAGERGGALRDNEKAQDEARAYRSLYREARKRCMFRR